LVGGGGGKHKLLATHKGCGRESNRKKGRKGGLYAPPVSKKPIIRPRGGGGAGAEYGTADEVV